MRLTVITSCALLLFVAPAVLTGSQNNDSKHCPISKTQAVSTVSFCDVVREPTAFEGKLVRVKVSFLVGGETRIIDDAKCEGAVWVEFDNVSDACTDKEMLQRLWKRDPAPSEGLFNGLFESEIVAVGLFLH